MNKRDFDFTYLMCKGTEDTVFTLVDSERELVAELGSILDRTVELLDIVVAEDAVIPVWTFLALFYSSADLTGVVTSFSPSVILVVVEHAMFVVVGLFFLATLRLEQF